MKPGNLPSFGGKGANLKQGDEPWTIRVKGVRRSGPFLINMSGRPFLIEMPCSLFKAQNGLEFNPARSGLDRGMSTVTISGRLPEPRRKYH
ncbi:hypothetical protein SAMN05428946_1866 [Edaphobacillus lindanitolerans]|uniref:Uncharacterized protein n=1 Tax=Edaphobacillus lindanitolerans TaxID=550447 RepID=A0A1U7PR67_9BACI|nr:hypothetical protein SAMN05428946_1866 [Edaphobacillus lindanitolerans]